MGSGSSQFLCSQKFSPWTLPLWDALQNEQITSLLCASGALQITFHALFPQVVSLPFLQEQYNAIQSLSQPSPLTFKTPGVKFRWLSEVTKFSPSHFPSQLLSVHSLYVSLSLTLFRDCGSLPNAAATIHFFTTPRLHTFLWSLLCL